MDIFQPLIDFYNDNEGLAMLLFGAGTGLLGFLLRHFLSTISSIARVTISKLGEYLGGRWAYKRIKEKYLDWVVLENQDLNLTGIIGTGQKPQLSQVFVSLRLLENILNEDEESEFLDTLSNKQTAKWKALWNDSRLKLKNLTIFSRRTVSSHSIFKKQNLWRVRRLIERDNLDTAFAIVFVFSFFLIIPTFLLLFLNVTGFAAGLSFALLSIIIGTTIISFQEASFSTLKQYSFWLELIVFFAMPILTGFIYLNNHPFDISILIGIAIGGGTVIAFSLDEGRLRQIRIASDDRLEIGKLLDESNNIAILGEPGSGKSTYIQFLALILAQEKAGDKKFRKKNISKKWLGSKQWYLPILIPLRKVSRYLIESEIHSDFNLLFDAFKYEVMPSHVRDKFSNDFLHYMLKKKECIFLLDGLDEVADDREFRKVVNEIKGLVSQYPGNKFIITSRYSGWRGGVGSDFVETEIRELSDNQISTFIQSWYRAIEMKRDKFVSKKQSAGEQRHREQEALTRAKNLELALQNNISIRNLAKNPLLLSMICFVHYNKTLPRERLSLYEDCSKLLLEQWDIEKGLPQDDIPLNFKRKEIIMQEIAFSMHSGKIDSTGKRKEAKADEIIQIVKRLLRNFGLDNADANEIFEKLVKRTGLIISTENYRSLYAFSHLTFQEFYTAKFLYSQNIDVFKVIEESDHNDLTQLTKWWREVILLYSSMQSDTSNIILQLIEMARKDVQMRGLQMAAQSFLESVNTPNEQVESILLSQLYYVYSKGQESNPPATWDGKLKHYLLRFSGYSNRFRERAFLTLVNQIKTNDEIDEVESVLTSNLLTDDGEIQAAASVALTNFYKTHHSTQLKNPQKTIRIIKNAQLELQSIALQILTSRAEAYSAENINQIYDIVVESLFERNYLFANETNAQIDLKIREILRTVSTETFQSVHQKLIDKLTELLKEENYFPENFRFTYSFYNRRNIILRPLDYAKSYANVFNVFLETLLKLDERQKHLHIQAILEMLEKGSEDQQILAINYAKICYKEERMILNDVLRKLWAPYKIVRIAVLSFIRQTPLDSGYINRLTSLLEKAIRKKKRLRRLGDHIFEILFGKGALGATEEEKIHIVATLIHIDYAKYSFLLKQILSETTHDEFLRNRYHWIMIIADIGHMLHEDEIKRIMEHLEEMPNTELKIEIAAALINILPENLKEQMMAILIDSKSSRSIRLLNLINPRISQNNEFHFKLLEKISDENFDEATAAFDIALSNNLI